MKINLSHDARLCNKMTTNKTITTNDRNPSVTRAEDRECRVDPNTQPPCLFVPSGACFDQLAEGGGIPHKPINPSAAPLPNQIPQGRGHRNPHGHDVHHSVSSHPADLFRQVRRAISALPANGVPLQAARRLITPRHAHALRMRKTPRKMQDKVSAG